MMDKQVIGDCTLYCGEERRKHRARGHKKALRLFPQIGPCVKCRSENSERHHIDDNPHNNKPENIMPLCRRCHTIEHGKTFTRAAINSGVKAAAEKRLSITHCRRGHPYSGANLYVTPTGKRVCKECSRIAKRKYREAKRCE